MSKDILLQFIWKNLWKKLQKNGDMIQQLY